MTAHKAGNPGVDVLSTPMLLQLIEEAAMQCLAPSLEDGQISLGTYIDLTHLAPTPVGFILRTGVEVVAVNGARVSFAVSAFDEREKVAEGTHGRFVANRAAFLESIEEKLS